MSKIRRIEESFAREDLPQFKVGDTVDVHCLIKEGEKERIQIFNGTVIRKRGGGMSATYTVRRIVQSQGVERTFPIHSPFVTKVEVKRSGKTRRARLYYLRDRTGKATRLKEIIDLKRTSKPRRRRRRAAAETAPAETPPPAPPEQATEAAKATE